MALSVEGFAQKGMNSVGVEIPVTVGLKNVWAGVGIKYQYNISDFIRVEPSFSYFPMHSSNSYEGINWHYGLTRYTPELDWKIMGNLHFFVQRPKPVRPFLIIGGGFSKGPYNSWVVNSGIGLDIRIAYHWSMQLNTTAVVPLRLLALPGESGKIHKFFNGGIGLSYNF